MEEMYIVKTLQYKTWCVVFQVSQILLPIWALLPAAFALPLLRSPASSSLFSLLLLAPSSVY